MKKGISAHWGNIGQTLRNVLKPLFTFISVTAVLAPPLSWAEATVGSNRVVRIAASLPATPAGLGRPANNRAVWERLARSPGFASQVAAAEKLARTADPALSDELFLDYSRTGNRDRCQCVKFERGERLTTFVLAECMENKGRFIQPLTNTHEAHAHRDFTQVARTESGRDLDRHARGKT